MNVALIIIISTIFSCFQEVSENCKEKAYIKFVVSGLSSSGLSVCLSARPPAQNILAPIGQIVMKYYISVVFKNLCRKLNLN